MKTNTYLVSFIVLLLGSPARPDTSPLPKGPQKHIANSSKACAICHIRWLTSFENGQTKTVHRTMKSVRQAGSADMCLSCHDGSVVDSRFKVWSTRNHVSGKLPPDWVHIPEDLFPLDEKGNMTCATCHSAHAIKDDADIKSVIFLRQPNVNSSFCLLCHTQYKTGMQIQHPLGKVNIKIPQKILEADGRTTQDGRTILCQTCHEPHGTRNPRMLVLPAFELCTVCHTDKTAEAADATNEAMHRIGYKFPGFTPPEKLIQSGAQFGFGGEIYCLSCHKMHGGNNKKALLIQEDDHGSLCLECHVDKRAFIGATHDISRSAPDAVNRDGLKASQTGVCGACHKSHGWARARVKGETDHNGPLCIECHQKGGIAWKKRPYKKVHPINISLPDAVQTDLKLRGIAKKISCSTCHEIHTPNKTEALLRKPVKVLCKECHREKQGIFMGLHDPAKSSWAKKRGIQVEGLCTDCHKTHKVRRKYGLWQKIKGSNKKWGTCQGCHQQKGPGKAVMTEHLHKTSDTEWVHSVNGGINRKSDKILCRTCHEIHQKEKIDKLLRVPLSNSRICTKCHPATKALFGTLHDLRYSAPNAKNVHGETAEQSGPCSVCHLIHDVDSTIGPWAFDPIGFFREKSFVDGLCLGCHQRGGSAENRIPAFVDHPEVSLFNRGDPRNAVFLPTYSENGGRSSTGTVTCLSCHEPHTGPVTHQLAESDTSSAREKFLRLSGNQNLCIDCHGIEALWRLLYFHRRDKLPFSRNLGRNQ